MAKGNGQGKGADIDQRVRKIYLAMLKSPSNSASLFHLISEIAKTEGWNVTDRTIHNYIGKAKELLALYQPQEIAYYKKLQLGRLEDIYMKQMIADDHRGAVRTLDRIANLLGLNAPVHIQTTVEHKTVDELKADLDKLVKRRKKLETLTFSKN